VRHFVDRLPLAIFVAGLAAPLFLSGCGRATPAGENPTMTLLREGSGKVCTASEVQKVLRELIVPKPADLPEAIEMETRVGAVDEVSLSYDLTTLQSFDSGVSRASCNSTVAIRAAGSDKSSKFRIDYAVSPSADNAGSIVVTGNVDDARAFASGLVDDVLTQAAGVAAAEHLAQEMEKEKQQLLAVVNERWLQGAWIRADLASSECGGGKAIWFEPSHVMEGALGRGRWALTGDQLHLVGGDEQRLDVTGTITQADPISLQLATGDGDPLSLRRCTPAETETLPEPTPDGSVAE
jgi:hypothetical protein